MPALPRLAWPLPALLAWSACWAGFLMLPHAGVPSAIALALACALGVALCVLGATPWRRVFIAAGFPLSLAASGLAGPLPGWAWLLPLALLALFYPLNAWRDAPVFPTPAGALRGLAAKLPLADGAHVLDAGCGLGDGLRELHREYPKSRLVGLDWSWPLRFISGWRCPYAVVRRGDIWAADWSGYDLVYLFQRPESMARAAAKAGRELKRGAWFASLEFEVPALQPQDVLQCADGRRVWLYRVPYA